MSMTCEHSDYYLPGRKICNDCAARSPSYNQEENQSHAALTRELYEKEAKMGASQDHAGY